MTRAFSGSCRFVVGTLRLSKKNLEDLELMQRSTLKRIQHFPKCTASVAVLLLVVLLVEATIDKNILTLFLNMARLDGSREKSILQRQLAVKDEKSHSFIITVKEKLRKYDLPTAFTLLRSPPTKTYGREPWRKQSLSGGKSIFRRKPVPTESCNFGSPHHVWSTTDYSPHDIIRANIKSTLLIGQYPLQAVIARCTGGPSTCKLCQNATEDLEHF